MGLKRPLTNFYLNFLFSQERTMQQLATHGWQCEAIGGDIQSENISAKTGTGVEELMEKVLMERELLGISTDKNARVQGSIIEAQTNANFGSTSTIIIKHGVLKKGQILVSGVCYAKVKALFDENNKPLQKGEASQPISV